MTAELTPEQQHLHHERWELLEHIDTMTQKPMIALAFVWLGLLILDLTHGLGRMLQIASYIIWLLFILDFLLEFTIAPHKGKYLRKNWLTVVSLVLPALRVLSIFRALRILQAIRAIRTVSLLRVVTSLNRGIRATAQAIGSRSIGYVVSITILVIFVGAAGMATFESPNALRAQGHETAVDQGAGLKSYSESVWWTAMLMTTSGSDYWPKTVEGRILCWLLAVYAFAIFGYITANIASFLIGKKPAPETSEENVALQAELASLRQQIALLHTRLDATSDNHSPDL
jgi:voltage-gated potassium channel